MKKATEFVSFIPAQMLFFTMEYLAGVCNNVGDIILEKVGLWGKMKILKNNLYSLGICFKAAPLYVCMRFLIGIADYAISTVISLYFMRYIVEAVQANRTFGDAFAMILGMFAVKAATTILINFVECVLAPQANIKITALLMEMLYGKAISVDLSCYENPKFYDSYTKANGK